MQMAVAMQDAAQRAEVLQEVKRLAVSYAGLVIQFPDSFAASSSSISAVTVLTEKLLEDRISPDFLAALVKWSNEENNLDAVRPNFHYYFENRLSVSVLSSLSFFLPLVVVASTLAVCWCPFPTI